MTELGICHNATFPAACLTRSHIERLKPKWARTITYWRDDASSWKASLSACRELAALGVENLVVFNTEAFGGQVDDLNLMCRRLDEFLTMAGDSLHAIEPGNELDTPGWTDSRGRPISDDLIITIGRQAAEVCHRHGVLCLSPSLLTGPTEGRFQRVVAGLAGVCDAMAVHPYGRSVGGQPSPGWLHGTVEDAADECRDLGNGMRTWFTELGCWAAAGDRGFEGQKRYIEELGKFNHPAIETVFYFAAFDAMVPEAELRQGKDWGMVDLAGNLKPCFEVFDGQLDALKPPLEGAEFVGGFKKMYDLAPELVGDPLETEFGPTEGWSAQRTTNGWLFWSDLKQGAKFALFHDDGRRFLWSEEGNWPTMLEITGQVQTIARQKTRGPARVKRRGGVAAKRSG